MSKTTNIFEDDLCALQRSLEREAQVIIDANSNTEDAAAIGRTYVVCDFEYRFRRSAHDGWVYGREPDVDDRGKPKPPKIRWPFHDIAAVSWIVMRLTKGNDVPQIDGPFVLGLDDRSEKELVQAFFDALLDAGGTAQLVTWGGEVRDLAVLRYQACRFGLLMPLQLRGTSPHSRERTDLCRSVAVQADPVHLDEYAAGAGIPAKPSPPRTIGKMAEAGRWDEVRDHVLADVLTSAVIALRWLASTGEIECHRERSEMAIADAAAAAFPDSPFLQRDFKTWARDRLRAAGMGGTVYRIEETVS
ncbi:3'-5' exonuclease [Qipengyuania sp. GH25]|uniref:3'-5' exonuclease n=1 Tax=Qipengyuania pacifica TaxID=2860199 RepID=A0ABS7JID6_9SPHN|nr:3'-5' exonuclease [Qipengyuania aerophila]MBX7489533.1 3'-5' exonuclease [Qipengyuania aerophila]